MLILSPLRYFSILMPHELDKAPAKLGQHLVVPLPKLDVEGQKRGATFPLSRLVRVSESFELERF